MRRPGGIALLLLLVTAGIAKADGCATTAPPDNVIKLTAMQTTTDAATIPNPMAGKAVVKGSAKVSWLTEGQFMKNAAPEPAATTRFPLTLGFCTTDGAGKAAITYPVLGIDSQQLVATPAFAVQFSRTEGGNGEKFVRYLKFEWAESASGAAGQAAAATDTPKSEAYRVEAVSGVADYSSDARYKLWAYMGYTFMRSKNDFKDSYPEFLLRTETRWYDDRVFMKRHHPDEYNRVVKLGCFPKSATDDTCTGAPNFSILRLYGDMGFIGTAVATTNAAGDTVLGKAKQAFASSIGVGYGRTLLVSTLRDTDTSAFSAMGVARLGLATIPGNDDTALGPVTQSRSSYDYSINLRIENEPAFRDDNIRSGNFEGAYFEIGVGESERYSRKKFPRLRTDALLPIGGGSNLIRFATRLQIDTPRPFHRVKNDPKDPPDNLGNEIRLSIVFNIDLLELGKRISGK